MSDRTPRSAVSLESPPRPVPTVPVPEASPHPLVRPATIRLLWMVLIGAFGLSLVGELFVYHKVIWGVDGSLFFNGWYGFLCFMAMVLGAKGVGALLKRDDTYYGEDPGPARDEEPQQ